MWMKEVILKLDTEACEGFWGVKICWILDRELQDQSRKVKPEDDEYLELRVVEERVGKQGWRNSSGA